MPSITSKRRQLCSIEEAWNLPISLEMSSRQQQQHLQQSSNSSKRHLGRISVCIIIYDNIIAKSKKAFLINFSLNT